MGNHMKKRATLLLVAVLTVSSLLMIEAMPASAATKPAVPEFTVELVDSSYDVPTTYSINPYTGKNVTHEGYRVESRTIEVRIKNAVPNDSVAGSYYNIRWKGHFEEEWREFFHSYNGFLSRDSGAETVFSREGEYLSSEGLKMDTPGMDATFPPDSQIDFQVEAMIGSIQHRIASFYSYDVFVGETSGWSETQTLTIENQMPTSSPTPTSSQTPTMSELVATILGVVIVAVVIFVGVGLLFYFKKRRSGDIQS
jgi:hypothetical protein